MSVWRDIIGTGDIKAVQKHIYFDADVNAKDNEGITVLQHARDKYVPGVKTLLKAHRAE